MKKQFYTFHKTIGFLAFVLICFNQGQAQTLSNLNGWHPNGGVRTMAEDANYIYIGGGFTALTKASVGTVTRNRIARIQKSDMELDLTWDPDANNTVETLALSGTDLYVGGQFTNIGGQARNRIARLSTSGTGTADATWNPNANNIVFTLALSGTDLYVGGFFTNIGGQPRNRIAKLSTGGTGMADATWNPNANQIVRVLVLSGTDLYVGGAFTNIGGEPRNRIARLSTGGTGTADATWNPNANNQVLTLALSGTDLYAGGFFTNIGGENRFYITKLSTGGTGAADASWNPTANAPVWSFALSGTDLYVGGQFTNIGGQAHHRIARLSTGGTGTADASWNPNANNVVWSLTLSGTDLYAAGTFTSMSGSSLNHFARFSFADINVQGNASDIAGDDSNIPNTSNDTDFGLVVFNKTISYTIENTIGDDLTVSAIDITGIHASDFVVGGITLPVIISAGSSTTFTVTFTPTAVGARDATVEISSDDPDEGTYIYDIQGTKGENNALNFDGSNDYIQLADNLSGVGNGDFTMECWFRTNSTANQFIFAKDLGGVAVPRFSVRTIGGSLIFHGNTNQVSHSGIMTNQWYHLAIVRTSSATNMYLDGILVGSTGGSYDLGSNSYPYRIGARGNTIVQQPLNGDIDEFRIWNTARTCAEIQANMNNELTGSEANLLAYYNFNQGIAGGDNSTLPLTLTDKTGSNNGTLINFNGLDGSIDSGETSNWVAGATGITSAVAGTGSEINITAGTSGSTIHVGGLTEGANSTLNYTIENTGDATLVLTGSPLVNITGQTNVNSVSISTNPNTSIAGGSSTTFSVDIDPMAGDFTVDLEIANSDCDEGTYTLTLEGKGIHETPEGTRGNMMSFDGVDDHVEIPALNLNSNTVTIEAWIKPNASQGNYAGIIMSHAGNTIAGLNFRASSGEIGYHWNNGASNTWSWAGGPSFIPNTWQHVALVIEPTQATIYLNGVASGTNSIAHTAEEFDGNTVIGKHDAPCCTDRLFNGEIEEVRIWNVARTESEIRENMHLILKGSETGLVAYYQFNEDAGNAIDKVGGNNGTLENGVSRVTSEVAVAGGTSKTVNITSSTTDVSLDETNMAIDFGAGTVPNGDIVVYQLNEAPHEPPTGFNTTSRYWVVRNFGTNNTSLDIDEVSFRIPNHNEISSTDEVTPNNMLVYKRGSAEFLVGDWNNTDAMGTSASNETKQITFNTSAASGFTSFSQFIVGSNGNSGLPITLLDFKAQRADEKQVQLTWATALEKDNAGFEIEMSTDGENFQKVGFVEGQGNSSEVISYEFIMNNSNAGYYRLKQVDFNGSFEYSELRFVEGVKVTRSLSIVPNPSAGQVRLNLENIEENETFTLHLLDSKGQTILETKGNLNQVNEHLNSILGRASKGLYFLEVQSGTERFIERIILQ